MFLVYIFPVCCGPLWGYTGKVAVKSLTRDKLSKDVAGHANLLCIVPILTYVSKDDVLPVPFPSLPAAHKGSSPPVVPNLCESGKAWKSGRMSSPSDIFFYIFLPPLLLDSAVRIDFYVFRKVQVYQAMRWFEPALLTNKQASSSPPLLCDVKCLSRGWRGPGRRRFGGGLNHVTVPDLCVRPCRAEHLSVDPHHVSVIGGHGLILQPLAAGILRP
eukprot:1159341-Pelagomonas_calceolata.AAC.15